MLQSLQTPHLFSFPKTLNPPPNHHLHHHHLRCHPLFPRPTTTTTFTPPKSFSSDEFPVDETFLQNFAPKDKETEDEARRKNWIDRGWAPWEEILTPEADFAKKSLNEGEEVPLQTPEAIEAFKMLSPSYRLKKIKEMGLTEDEWYKKQFEIKGEIPEKLQTVWAGPLVVRHVVPRDWPPRGWEVDRKELEFIREGHKMENVRVELEGLESRVVRDSEGICLDRYKVFLKQYKEWVDANKDRLEEDSYKVFNSIQDRQILMSFLFVSFIYLLVLYLGFCFIGCKFRILDSLLDKNVRMFGNLVVKWKTLVPIGKTA